MRYLRDKGYTVLETNVFYKQGEIDVVAKSPDGCLVFAEIKTALTPDFGDPAERVNKKKQRQIGRAAEIYLFKNRLGQPACRFDVLAVRIKEGSAPQITHYENAFML